MKKYKKNIKKECLLCKKIFKTYVGCTKIGSGKYCSNKCKNKSLKGKPTWNKGIKIDRIKYPSMGHFQKHSLESCLKMRGEHRKDWKGGVSKKNNEIRRCAFYMRWVSAIYKRDKYTCQICGKKNLNLRANHIKRFADFPDLRFEINNGILICRECDYRWVLRREEDWESYFNFNLMTKREYE